MIYGHRKDGQWTVRVTGDTARLVHKLTLADTDKQRLDLAKQIQQVARRPS